MNQIGKGTSTESTFIQKHSETFFIWRWVGSKNGTFPNPSRGKLRCVAPSLRSAPCLGRSIAPPQLGSEKSTGKQGRSVEHCHTTSKHKKGWKIGWKIEHQWNWKTWNISKAQPMREVATSAHLAVLRIRGTFDVRQRSQTYVLNEELIARSRDWLRPLDSLVNES